MAQTERFNIPISQEGETGPIRGKIPTSMVNAMGMDDGDVLVLETRGKTVVGGHAATGKEAARYRSEIAPRGRTGGGNGGNGKTGHKVGKGGKKKVVAKGQKSGSAKSAKSNKRKTSVKYDSDRPSKKKFSVKKKKSKRNNGW
jgi:hypothetical protein